ncbi:MAG: hypothetical protein EOM67_13765 [Spirochaetia bacterium]|nr:hypothetical protein [Spirochaetia bacterium]
MNKLQLLNEILASLLLLFTLSILVLGGFAITKFIRTEANLPVEYQYKDFSSIDIEKAMKYHGTLSCIIKEGEPPYFVDSKGREVVLFTESCVEYLYKNKER